MPRSIDPVRRHRRDVWLKIILPVALSAGLIMLALVLIFVGTVSGTFEPEQVTVMASIFLSLCIVLPLLILAAVGSITAIAMAWGAGKLPRIITPPLRGIRESVDDFAAWLPTLAERLTDPLIALMAQLTRLEQIIGRLVGFYRTEEETADSATEES